MRENDFKTPVFVFCLSVQKVSLTVLQYNLSYILPLSVQYARNVQYSIVCMAFLFLLVLPRSGLLAWLAFCFISPFSSVDWPVDDVEEEIEERDDGSGVKTVRKAWRLSSLCARILPMQKVKPMVLLFCIWLRFNWIFEKEKKSPRAEIAPTKVKNDLK